MLMKGGVKPVVLQPRWREDDRDGSSLAHSCGGLACVFEVLEWK